MLSKRVDDLPSGDDWIFEPKWDGFRALVFRDGDEILIQSRDQKSLNRYFPELLEPLRGQLPARCVLDGEIVVAKNGGLDFEALQLRIHPAASRVKLLSQESPGIDRVLRPAVRGRPRFAARTVPATPRRAGIALASATPPIHLTPATRDLNIASDWFQPLRRRGSRRRHGQADLRRLRARQARDVQGQARARLRLRRRRISMAQGKRERTADRLAAARPLRRCGHAAARRRLRELHAQTSAANWSNSSRLIASDALANHPWKHWAEHEA